MSEAYDFFAGHGGRDLCSWVRGLGSNWTATCVEAVRPFVEPPPPAPSAVSWTPYQAELVWRLGLPLDPLGGLPFRVVAWHGAASTPTTTTTTATTTTTHATTTTTTTTPTTTTTTTATAATPAKSTTATSTTGAEDDVTSQSRWWAFVRESLGNVAPSELPGLDSIAMRRRTEASEPRTTADLSHVPKAHRALARTILLQHHNLEVQARKAGLTAPERRDMLGLGARPRGAYLGRMEETLQRAHVWRDHQVTGAVLLLSSPGCRKQRWHRDYATHRYRRNACPLARLLALDNLEPCRLHIFNASRLFCEPHEQVVYVLD